MPYKDKEKARESSRRWNKNHRSDPLVRFKDRARSKAYTSIKETKNCSIDNCHNLGERHKGVYEARDCNCQCHVYALSAKESYEFSCEHCQIKRDLEDILCSDEMDKNWMPWNSNSYSVKELAINAIITYFQKREMEVKKIILDNIRSRIPKEEKLVKNDFTGVNALIESRNDALSEVNEILSAIEKMGEEVDK